MLADPYVPSAILARFISVPSAPVFAKPQPEDCLRGCLIEWEASHDNGWETLVSEEPDGHFRATTRAKARRGFSSERETLEEARAEALAALERTTNHRSCSADCSEWVLRLKAPA